MKQGMLYGVAMFDGQSAAPWACSVPWFLSQIHLSRITSSFRDVKVEMTRMLNLGDITLAIFIV